MISQVLSSCNTPKATGPYSNGIQLGDFIYLSGQLPLDPVSGEIVGTDIQTQTKQIFHNIQFLLEEVGLELRHIVKTTIFMTNLDEMDLMNEVYARFFSTPFPASTTVGVSALPKGAKISVECYVIDTSAYEQSGVSGCSGCGQCCEGGDCSSCLPGD